ncbi:MAG: hypothetical protein HZB59_02145 [Ignavibacteriales bacterium]|nr:hypothetical protein [Ignavibacteriales bacterium]
MKPILVTIPILLLLLTGCPKNVPDNPLANKSPNTFLWLFPDSTLADGTSKQHIKWWGDDPDGVIKGYLFSFDTVRYYDSTGIIDPLHEIGWRWREGQDTIIAFPLERKRQTFYVAVKAVDNNLATSLDDQALIRFVNGDAYWDKNENGSFDGNDVKVTFPANSLDPTAATLDMPTLNQPPTVVFSPNPANPTVPMAQPETTYTAVTFAWVGTDPDGDKTIVEYQIALNDLNDTTRLVTLNANNIRVPGNDFRLSNDYISLITLYVPRSRSDASSGEVDADIYSGSFLKRQKIGTIRGLKLDSLNIFYLRGKDIAGDYSPFIRTPDPGKKWFVKKPQTKLLGIIDYNNSDSTIARNTYRKTFSNIVLPSGTVSNYDELNIGRGVTLQQKKDASDGRANPQYGVLVPPFIDPAFTYTLFLFDYVFWYTDVYPSLPVAQFSLFHYYSTLFDGHKGRVIFSTSFEYRPDPLNVINDFAPLDSISAVNLASFPLQLPRFGDSRVLGGSMLIPDSSESDNIYPPLRFNLDKYSHLVYIRPIYRRADARYIYHLQEDEQLPKRYSYTKALNELKSVAITNGAMTVCGTSGLILNSTTGGDTWSPQKSGTQYTLNSIQLFDNLNGTIVGDSGTILRTNNGGMNWTSQSILTYETLAAVDFINSSAGLIVGSHGLVIRTTDGGVKWDSYSSSTRKTLRGVDYYDASNAIAVGDSVIIKSTDGGLTWHTTGPANRTLYAVRYLNSSTVFAIGANGTLLRSTDGGDQWNPQPGLSGQLRSIFFLDQNNGWISGRDGILFVTSDGGQTWTSQSGLGIGLTQHLNSVQFLSPEIGICTGTGSVIMRTTNGGLTWTTQPKGYIDLAVIDGTKNFVFVALPLHLLNGNPTVNEDGGYLKPFFEHILLKEFAQ